MGFAFGTVSGRHRRYILETVVEDLCPVTDGVGDIDRSTVEGRRERGLPRSKKGDTKL